MVTYVIKATPKAALAGPNAHRRRKWRAGLRLLSARGIPEGLKLTTVKLGVPTAPFNKAHGWAPSLPYPVRVPAFCKSPWRRFSW